MTNFRASLRRMWSACRPGFIAALVLASIGLGVAPTPAHARRCDQQQAPLGSTDRWIARKALGSFLGVDITTSSKTPETTPDPRGVSEVEIDAPAGSTMGAPLNATVTIRNLDAQPRDFTCYVAVRTVAQNGNVLAMVSGPRTDLVAIGAGGAAVVNADVAWNQLQPFVGVTEFVEFDVVVTRVHDTKRWFKQRVTVIRGLPVAVTLAPAGQVIQPAAVVATITCSNPLQVPLDAGTLRLMGGSELPINGTARDEVVSVGPLAPGETVTFTRTLSPAMLGQQCFSALWSVPGSAPGGGMAVVTVLPPCPADVDRDGLINFTDFSIVISNCGQSVPPCTLGDVNGDGVVDFVDLSLVLAAYGSVC